MKKLANAETKVGTFTLEAAQDNILKVKESKALGDKGYAALIVDGAQKADITAGRSNELKGERVGAFVTRLSTVELKAKNGDNVISGSHVGVLTEKASDTEISSSKGTTHITASNEKSAAVLSLAGGHTTINGKTDITGTVALAAGHTYTGTYDGIEEKARQDFPKPNYIEKYNKRMLKEFAPSLIDSDREHSWIKVNYGSGSSITGMILTLDGGAITVSPQEGEDGGMTLNGDVYASSSPNTANSYVEILGAAGPYTTSDQLDTVSAGTIDLDLGSASTWNGKADTGLLDNQQNATSHAAGTLNVGLGNGSIWNMSDSSAISKLYGSGGTVRFKNGGDSLQMDTLTGAHTFAMDLDYADPTNSDMLYIQNGTGDSQTLDVKNIIDLSNQMQVGDKVRFATVKHSGKGFTEGRVYYVADGIYEDTLTVRYVGYNSDPETKNYDGDGTRKPTTETVAETYGGDGAYNVYLEKGIASADPEDPTDPGINEGAKTPGKAATVVWRYVTDLDTFTNRSGETQYFTPGADQGGWLRFKYRNLGVDQVGEIDGNTYEVGYTAIAKDTPEKKHRFSASLAYGRETGDWEKCGGDLKVRDMTVALYDTHEFFPSAEKMAQKPAWKQGTHSYWDNYLKYHHVRTEYNTIDNLSKTEFSGKYSQDIFNLSTEYGRENKLSASWSWVPQAQLQVSYIGGYDYEDSKDLHISADHDWSFIGRLGFDLVKQLDPKHDSKLYLKASVLHEFADGSDVTVRSFASDGYEPGVYRSDGDASGTWGVFGLGYSVKSGKNQYLYFDAERYVGNDFTRTYNLRAGLNWKF